MGKKDKFLIIDGSSYIYRAYHAIRNLSNSKGFPTNAVFGFTRMLQKIALEENPKYLVMAFDMGGKTHRHREYPDYKATRPPIPEDLVIQIPFIHRLTEAFNIKVVAQAGYEADDIIGTLVLKAHKLGLDVTIVSGDKDLMQLIRPGIKMYDSMKDKVITSEDVLEKFGVPPELVVEAMGLIGDNTDNIPGVPGIGPKTAAELIKQFGSIENLLENIDKIEKEKIRNLLRENAEKARLSRQLSIIDTTLPFEFSDHDFQLRPPNQDKLLEIYRELEFGQLIKEMSRPKTDSIRQNYQLILSNRALENLVEELTNSEGFALDTETTSKDPMLASLVGLSFSRQEGTGFYLPMGHSYPDVPEQLDKTEVLKKLKPILENDQVPKFGQNIKYDIIMLNSEGIELKGLSFDTMIASYLLNPSKRNHNLEDIALENLDYHKTTYHEVAGKGKKEINFREIPLEAARDYSAEDADITYRLTNVLRPKLKEAKLTQLFLEIEIPLVNVLARMEKWGVRLDADRLDSISVHLEEELRKIMKGIYALAGMEFNINSPIQLREVLFDKRGLKPVKRTKTGYSTDIEVLEELAAQDPLPAEILRFRQLAKLKSTYVDALPRLINPRTGRLHTSFNQTATATGRLSSSDPNLQNIPIRSDIGKEIREAFVAEPGHLLLSADYSQIELRVLAHLSEDPLLVQSFRHGEDVHSRTASEVFEVPLEKVNAQMRRMAKVVNFGIIYGLSPYGLSKDLKIDQKEAKKFIDNYFHRYGKVKEYLDKVVQDARENGFVSTIFGRIRHLPELRSPNKTQAQLAERMALNTPMQGSAADLIKLAMIRIDRRIQVQKLKTKMILQIHDELVFEVPEPEIEDLIKITKEEMEGVCQLKVPLKVDLGQGRHWSEAH